MNGKIFFAKSRKHSGAQVVMSAAIVPVIFMDACSKQNDDDGGPYVC